MPLQNRKDSGHSLFVGGLLLAAMTGAVACGGMQEEAIEQESASLWKSSRLGANDGDACTVTDTKDDSTVLKGGTIIKSGGTEWCCNQAGTDCYSCEKVDNPYYCKTTPTQGNLTPVYMFKSSTGGTLSWR